MSPVAAAEPDGAQRDRCVSKLIFFLFVFGAMLLCVGVLLSIFGFQACQYRIFQDCSVVLKVAGPACAAVGLGAVILARSRARLQLRESRLRGSPADPDRAFLCGESRQFVQCLIFGFLFLTSGMLISILGIWVPGCGSDWAQEALNETDSADTEPQMCGFLSLQIMGPLIVLMGLCFFVVAHVKRSNLHEGQDASESEDPQIRSLEPVQVTVGDSVILFPPPPPPYFTESSAPAATRSPGADGLRPDENPPSYYSIFNYGRTPALGLQGVAPEAHGESIYTISGAAAAPNTLPPPELPPRYEEKETAAASTPTLGSGPAAP
ncbi:transmembrane protein 171 [Vulpes vulpes]|uniref:Transmembrane protein 171 n=1 Tax=Vulpes vulpes TaxID=9627 RepID=A0A3Q7RA67_VULVU|nr:transmembrane protein 171 [Vulpes vulpes]